MCYTHYLNLALIRYLCFYLFILHVHGQSASPAVGENEINYLSESIVLTSKQPVHYISSPGYPDATSYPPNTQVEYDIQVKLEDETALLGARILLTFELFALEKSQYCYKDGFEIADTGTNPQTRVFCGSQTGRVVLADEASTQIRFFSDSTNEARGFSVKVEIYQSDCSKTIKGVDQGTLSSPRFPGIYPDNALCVWKIEAPPGKKIRLGFNELFNIQKSESQCINDYLMVSKTGNFSTDLSRYCGSEAPDAIYSAKNYLLIKFVSDCCLANRGFSASFSFIDDVDGNGPPTPSPDITPTCACGTENLNTERIINGEDVQPAHRFPWMTGLVNRRGVFCGSALISHQYVITAAHCVVSETPDSLQVMLGGYYIPTSPDPVAVEKIVLHPNFNKRNYENDIALVKLKEPVEYNTAVGPVCLGPNDIELDNLRSVVCGWGKTEEGGKESQTLKFVTIPTLPVAECMQKYGVAVKTTNLCAGGDKGDACQGDSGGPLFTKLNQTWYLIGVVSWGIGCGREGYPGVYTKVSAYEEWLLDETKDSAPCEGVAVYKPLQPNPEDCGLPNDNIQTRVVGGTEVQAMEYPWMAIIAVNGILKAAGVLISPNYVLTSVNWMEQWYPQYPRLFDVYLGRSDLSKREPTSKAYKGQRVVIHPNVNSPVAYNNDIALIQLERNVDPVFRSVCLPRTNDLLPDGSPVVGAGWGSTSGTNRVPSNVLLQVTLNVINRTKCSQAYPQRVTPNMMCAGAPNKDMCYGDSGAPLTSEYQGRMYLQGITSWGSTNSCAVPNYPSVFSSVKQFLPWIKSITGIAVA